MDKVNPDWRERLRRAAKYIDHRGIKTFAKKLSEPEKEGQSLPKTKVQRRAAAIVKETAEIASAVKVLPVYADVITAEYKAVPQISAAIKGPPREYAWTKDLPGYDAAFGSAATAVHRLWAATRAASAGHDSKTPRLDAFLHQIRAGVIKKGDPAIQRAIDYADKCGFSGNIRERIAEEFHNAEKRGSKNYCGLNVSDSLFYDLNWFHITIAGLWVGALFWLMPDWLIAEFLLGQKSVPDRFKCNRRTISQAVKQMGLLKHERIIVKSIGEGFQLAFIEGYPPKN
jgi:hypothetical protein